MIEDEDGDEITIRHCESMIQCFLKNFDHTLKDNGGVGGWLYLIADETREYVPYQEEREFSYGRFFYDNMLNIILVVIIIQIVAGIIIDKFGSLRIGDKAKNNDIKDYCFICGNNREKFERQVDKSHQGFNSHIKVDHYMWNYIFFTAFLEWKDDTEYNGIEGYVADKLEENDLSWFPFHR